MRTVGYSLFESELLTGLRKDHVLLQELSNEWAKIEEGPKIEELFVALEKEDVLYSQRAEYGNQVLRNLAEKLTERYGKGWGYEKLKHCVRSAYLFSEEEIGYAVRTQLSWTHLRSLMSIDDELKRSFYMEMTRLEHWDTRTLDEKIDQMLYERTALSKKPENLIKQELQQIKKKTRFRLMWFFGAAIF